MTPADDTPPPAPRPIRLAMLGLCALVGVSAVGGAVAASLGLAKVLPACLGYEVVVLVAAVIGVLLGAGRFRAGFGLAALCVAGTFVTGAYFGLFKDLRLNVPASQVRAVDALTGFRVLAGGAVAALGGVAVLQRRPRSWGLLLRGVLVGAPVVGVLAWLALTRGSALTAPASEGADAVRTIAVVLGGLLLIVLTGVATHLCIRAFESTRPDDAPGA